jgi:hypothetical protein
MSKFSGFYKVVEKKPLSAQMADSQDLTGTGVFSNYSWYSRLIAGSASRLSRYREYDLMDNDVDIARALDVVAEEMTGNTTKSDEPLKLDFEEGKTEKLDVGTVETVKAALSYWVRIHDWENRLFSVARQTIKYGDSFFLKRSYTSKWEHIHAKNVVAAVVDADDVTKVQGWQVKKDTNKFSGTNSMSNFTTGTGQQANETEVLLADQVVRFTLNSDMAESAPFGESILKSVYRSYKQKELLEDALIIYRIQRAPERRVFYIDVGKMQPHKIKTYLEGIKNEIRQKRVPSFQGGQNEIDSVYNPHSMTEDFFLAVRGDQRGTRIDTLAGGSQGLGNLEDLDYFMRKVFRGLRIPESYVQQGGEGGASWNDGKVGVAYIQELRFAMYIKRMQGFIESVLDTEFKDFLKKCQIYVEPSLFRVRLPEPSNFGTYRQQELDAALLNTYSSADNITYLSKRFIMKRYLHLDDSEMVENEKLLREEKGLAAGGGAADYPMIYGGMMPEEGGGMEGMGGMSGFGGEMPMGDVFGGEMGAGMPEGGELPAGGEEPGEEIAASPPAG